MLNKVLKTVMVMNLKILALIVFGVIFMIIPDAFATDRAAEGTLGQVIERIVENVWSLPQLINYFGYIMAVFFMGLALFKLYSHVQYGPQSTQLIEPIKYFGITMLAAAMPTTANMLIGTFGGFGEDAQQVNNLGWSDDASGVTGSLDTMMMDFIQNVYVPMQWLFTIFCFIAGFMFLLIAIHRLTKTSQQGAQGPSGVGTIATFMLAAVMLSIAPSIGVVTETLFGGRTSMTTVQFMALSETMGDASGHAQNVLVSILAFLIIVGIVSMIRGFFILRGLAEGQQQMTMMSGLSHIIAGAVLVNFGQFANIIQNTLGITEYGVLFQ